MHPGVLLSYYSVQSLTQNILEMTLRPNNCTNRQFLAYYLPEANHSFERIMKILYGTKKRPLRIRL